jgi:hypothetical protein
MYIDDKGQIGTADSFAGHVPCNQWVRIVITYDEANRVFPLCCYVNGVLQHCLSYNSVLDPSVPDEFAIDGAFSLGNELNLFAGRLPTESPGCLVRVCSVLSFFDTVS